MDRDLASVQEARDLVRRADEAQRAFARATQDQTDRVVQAMARAASGEAERLARGGLAAISSSTNRFFTAMSQDRQIPGTATSRSRRCGKRISPQPTGSTRR